MNPTTVLSKGNYDKTAAISPLKWDLAQDLLYLILFWTNIVIKRKSPCFLKEIPKSCVCKKVKPDYQLLLI